MKKIIDYWVIDTETSNELTQRVTDLINEGWQPYGSMCSRSHYVYQPMVKYEEEKEVLVENEKIIESSPIKKRLND